MFIHPNGDKEWRQHGLLHREDGPARECVDGNKEWYANGLRHRLDGPAIDYGYARFSKSRNVCHVWYDDSGYDKYVLVNKDLYEIPGLKERFKLTLI